MTAFRTKLIAASAALGLSVIGVGSAFAGFDPNGNSDPYDYNAKANFQGVRADVDAVVAATKAGMPIYDAHGRKDMQ